MVTAADRKLMKIEVTKIRRKKWADLQNKIDYPLLKKQLKLLERVIDESSIPKEKQEFLYGIEELLSEILLLEID